VLEFGGLISSHPLEAIPEELLAIFTGLLLVSGVGPGTLLEVGMNITIVRAVKSWVVSKNLLILG
jgi:hypothetical protein